MIGLDPLFRIVASGSLGMLFLAAGAHKLASRTGFADAVAGYRLMPAAVVPIAAAAVGLAELLLGGAAIAGGFSGSVLGLASITAMLLLYAGAIATNLLRGRSDVDCGCAGFGARRETIGWDLVARNLVLASLAVLPIALPRSVRPFAAADIVAALGAFLSFALIYHTAGRMRTLQSARRLA